VNCGQALKIGVGFIQLKGIKYRTLFPHTKHNEQELKPWDGMA